MSDENKPTKVVFAPGCFDNFEGTQEELDDLIAEIHKMVETGEIFDKSKPLDPDMLSDEELEILSRALDAIDDDEDIPPNRTLN